MSFLSASAVPQNSWSSLGQLFFRRVSELGCRTFLKIPGYFQDPEATRETFDPDGWFRTGDLARIDNGGSLYLIGRKKDLFNCADGSNINPGTIEALLENDSFIRQPILLGDHRPLIAALIVPERRGIVTALDRMETELSDQGLQAALKQRVDMINTQLDRYEKIRKTTVISDDFPEELRSPTALQKDQDRSPSR